MVGLSSVKYRHAQAQTKIDMPQIPKKTGQPTFDGPKIRLADLRPNDSNPRFARDHRFKKLVESVKSFPKMMALRPITVDSRETPVILGGNQRYQALLSAGYKEVPREWVVFADEAGLSDDEKRRFIVQDNVNAGEWDYDALANEFSAVDLLDWGLDLQIDPGSPATGEAGQEPKHLLQTVVGDVYQAVIGDDPAHAIGVEIAAPKYIGGSGPSEGENDPWKGVFGEIDKSLRRFARNCKKSGLSFIITKNGEDITTKF